MMMIEVLEEGEEICKKRSNQRARDIWKKTSKLTVVPSKANENESYSVFSEWVVITGFIVVAAYKVYMYNII